MKILSDIIGHEGIGNFTANFFTRMPYSVPSGAKNFTQKLTWEVIKDILDDNKSILRIVKNGVMTRDYASMSFEEAQKFHQMGHTLLLKNAEKSSKELLNLADDFSKSFKTEVDIQLYCTPEGHNAFGWHYDVEEVFIIQAKGSKHYTIRPNTIHPNPLVKSIPKDLGYEKETSDIEIKVLMKEGDFLYIPSGWWHVAETQSESMHISIGLMPRSVIDIVEHLPNYLAKNSFWRTRFPVHQSFETIEDKISFYKEGFETLSKDLSKIIQDEDFILDFLTNNSRNSES